MSVEEKIDKIKAAQSKIDTMVSKKRALKSKCYTLPQCAPHNVYCNDNCHIDTEIRRLTRLIKFLHKELCDLQDTFSYAILDNTDAFGYWGEILSLIARYKTPKEQEQFSGPFPLGSLDTENLIKEIIDNRCYNELFEYVSKQKSRLAFFVLGAFLMNVGAKMSQDLREKILDYSSWKYEENQLFENIEERKKHLSDFRKKIKNYKNGVKVKYNIITFLKSGHHDHFYLPIDYII